jgi:hypothetical protein
VVVARDTDVTGISLTRTVVVPLAAKDRPVLHLVSIGINYAGNKDLALDTEGRLLSATRQRPASRKVSYFGGREPSRLQSASSPQEI